MLWKAARLGGNRSGLRRHRVGHRNPPALDARSRGPTEAECEPVLLGDPWLCGRSCPLHGVHARLEIAVLCNTCVRSKKQAEWGNSTKGVFQIDLSIIPARS